MRDRHIHISEDSSLLKLIYKQVDERLDINRNQFLVLIWIKLIFYITFSACFYATLFWVESIPTYLACFIAYGLFTLLFAFNFSHDFSHNTVFKNEKLNNICFVVIYTLVGAHAAAWKHRHVHSHHYAPNVEDYDSDLKISKLIRVIPDSEYRWYHRFQHLYAPIAYTSYSLFWVFVKDFVILFSKDEYESKKDFPYHVSFWLQKVIYLLIVLALPIMYGPMHWSLVLLGFLLMHLAQSLFLLFTFFMTHHVESTCYPQTDDKGYIQTSWLMNQIKSSNDMHPFSETANFILGGFNNHIAHHLFPHIHHIHYPKLNVILYEVLRSRNIIPNQTTYWGGVRSHLRLLKRMGK